VMTNNKVSGKVLQVLTSSASPYEAVRRRARSTVQDPPTSPRSSAGSIVAARPEHLLDDGRAIGESNAIILALRRRHRYVPEDRTIRAQARQCKF